MCCYNKMPGVGYLFLENRFIELMALQVRGCGVTSARLWWRVQGVSNGGHRPGEGVQGGATRVRNNPACQDCQRGQRRWSSVLSGWSHPRATSSGVCPSHPSAGPTLLRMDFGTSHIEQHTAIDSSEAKVQGTAAGPGGGRSLCLRFLTSRMKHELGELSRHASR